MKMTYVNEKTAYQAQILANRLQKKFRNLKKWAQKNGIEIFRLYDRDIPEIPLVLDFYGIAAKPEDAAVCGALYKRPYEKDETEEENWLLAMKESISLALGIKPERIFLKLRQRQRGSSQYEKFSREKFTLIASENNLNFKINFSDYLDSGFFPDRRLLRSFIRNEATGKKVLNLFSYTGSFSVYAAAGGAVFVDSVDLSNTYLAWARENFSLNGFSAQLMRQEDFFLRNFRSSNRLIRADVLNFIEMSISKKIMWDIIILDPPTFTNSKKMTDNFDLKRDKIKLLSRCLKLLAKRGKLFLSINMKGMKTSYIELESELKLYNENVKITDLTKQMTDEDFRNRKVPESFLINI